MGLTAPTWIKVDKTVIRSNEQITVSWGGTVSDETAYYEVQCRMYNGTSWTDWTKPIQCAEENCTLVPSEIFPEMKAGCFLDIRVSTFDNVGLQSTSSRKITDYVTVKGGGVHVCVNGVNREGTPFVYTDGTWKQGVAYIKHNEEWKEGV